MTAQTDLFSDYAPSQPKVKDYPNRAGYRGPKGGTSHKAAERIEGSGRAPGIARRIVRMMQSSGRSLIAEEIADVIGENIRSVAPRCTQLEQKGLLITTGEKRETSMGHEAQVYRAAVVNAEVA